jgi:hypothetical protein
MQSDRYACLILIKVEFSPQIFEKYSNIKFHENQSSASRGVFWGQTDGETDRNDEDKSRFSKFPERAWNYLVCRTEI